MGSSARLFTRHRTVHQILGGGIVADVILWRRKDVTLRIVIFTLATWVLFGLSGYTLLSFVSNVLLLLLAILFLWAKSSAMLNRPAPSLPHLHLSEEMANQMASSIRSCVNDVLSVSEEIALGRDTGMFIHVAGTLLVISILGSLVDFFTFCYTCIFMVLTVPAVYELYEDYVDTYAANGYRKLLQFYAELHDLCFKKIAEMRSLNKSS